MPKTPVPIVFPAFALSSVDTVVLVVAGLAIVAFGGYRLWRRQQREQGSQSLAVHSPNYKFLNVQHDDQSFQPRIGVGAPRIPVSQQTAHAGPQPEPVGPGNTTAVVDVTGQYGVIPPPAGLGTYPGGVPVWAHRYVYSADELGYATQQQKSFYLEFRRAFVRGCYYDLEGNTNYAFILLFDLIGSVNSQAGLTTAEGHLEKLGELYPKTKTYIRSSLYKRLVEIGMRDQAERLKSDLERQVGYSSYDYYGGDYWRFGSRHKKRLGLTDEEEVVLNQVAPSNNFLQIQTCCDAVIKVYLSVIKSLDEAHHRQQSSLAEQISVIADLVARKEFRYRVNSQNYGYAIDGVNYEIYQLIFKHCENAVREHFRHKRKLGTESYHAEEVKTELHTRLLNMLPETTKQGLAEVEGPDRDTEIALNRQNPTRWKVDLERLTKEVSGNGEDFVDAVKNLGELNAQNPSVEMIFYEASKHAAAVDRLAALELYMYYLHYDLRSSKFDDRKLTKTVQKSLFTNKEQLHEFDRIVSGLVSSRDLDAALRSAATFYVPKRRRIELNVGEIRETANKHAGTVDLLNEYLQDEFEDEQNKIIATDGGHDEMVIQILPKALETAPENDESRGLLSPVQLALVLRFEKNAFILSRDEVETFARENGLFRNQLIDGINDACYQLIDDVLIEEADDEYTIGENYYLMVTSQ